MLKKIIVSMLIPSFLIQILGCYSATEITKYDLVRMKNKEVINLVTKDSTEFLLQNPAEKINTLPWRADDKNIYIYPKSNEQQKDVSLTKADTIIIPLNNIESLSTDIYDNDKTVMWILGIGLIFSITLFAIIINGFQHLFDDI